MKKVCKSCSWWKNKGTCTFSNRTLCIGLKGHYALIGFSNEEIDELIWVRTLTPKKHYCNNWRK